MLVFDIETNGLLLDGDIIHCAVTYNLTDNTYTRYGPEDIDSFVAELSSAEDVIGHNILGFDLPFIKKLYPDFTYNSAIDTLLLSKLAYINLMSTDEGKVRTGRLPAKLTGSHSLKAWGYRLGELKGDFADETDWKEFSPEMLDYCEQDVKVTARLYKVLKIQNVPDEALQIEQEVQKIITQQYINGWEFDVEAAEKLHVELLEDYEKAEAELHKVFTPKYLPKGKPKTPKKPFTRLGVTTVGEHQPIVLTEFNPASGNHIVWWVELLYGKQDWYRTEKGNPKTGADELQEMFKDRPWATPLLHYLEVGKLLTQLATGPKAWLHNVRNGRIHGDADILGAVTGRFTHREPNIAQVPSNDAFRGHECRALFKVPKGYKLVGCDASGLELRTLSHYLARYDGGKYGRTVLEGDIHSANQEAAGLPTRNNAKTFIYAFLYGAGDAKIGSIVDGDSREGKRLKSAFLKRVDGLGNLVTAVKSAATKGFLKGLSGRKLYVRSPHSALNTLLQSAGAYVMKYYLVLLNNKLEAESLDYKFVGNIHDEVQIQVREDHAERVAELAEATFADVTTKLNFRISLEGEAKIGNNWSETH